MRNPHPWKFIAALGIVFAVSACAAPVIVPFQLRSDTILAYGYSDVKIDDTHYSVSYSDNNQKSADNFLELRAAQLTQGAGFHYFAFDKRGALDVTSRQNDLNYSDVRQHGHGQARDMVPQASPKSTAAFYYAWGRVALLTDDQARGNANALPVSEVLARTSAVTAP